MKSTKSDDLRTAGKPQHHYEDPLMKTPGTGIEPAQMVDLLRYPIEDITSTKGAAFADSCRQHYLQSGLCALPDFINPPSLDALRGEANRESDKAFFCDSTHNAYLTQADPHLPSDDIAKHQESTIVGSVAFDELGDDALLRKLYLWDPLKDFIGHVLGKPSLYRFADPLGACSINVFVNGGKHGWHFDESEFTVTLMLQQPRHGGSFEYVPRIRGLPNERQIVASVLRGGRDHVLELPFNPGTLLIFGGSLTLHRVTVVTGNLKRLVPVLCYSEQTNQKYSDAVRTLFWGRAKPIRQQTAHD